MSFINSNRKRVVVDCSDDVVLTEQHHKDSCDLHKLVSRFGTQHISRFLPEYSDKLVEVPVEDLQSAMNTVLRAEQSFMTLDPSVRKRFHNNSVEFFDFFNNPANIQELQDLGLVTIRQPAVSPSETPTAEPVVKPDSEAVPA